MIVVCEGGMAGLEPASPGLNPVALSLLSYIPIGLVAAAIRREEDCKLGWPAGLAPAPPPSQGGMLLLQHGQQSNVECGSGNAERGEGRHCSAFHV